MNVLFATSIVSWGGGENWMLSAARGLGERGHDVALAARAGSSLYERARERDLPVHDVRFRGDLDPPTTWFFYRLCRRLRCDILCLNMDKVLRVAGPGARAAGVRAVIPRRGSEMPIGGKISHYLSYRHLATGVIANSRATRRTMLASAPWLPPERVRVIYNGIRTEDYGRPGRREEVRRAHGVPPRAPLIGMVGELTGRKNHLALVRQLPALREQWPELRVWIAGRGPEERTLREEAERLGVAEAVSLLGFRRDVPALLDAVDLLVHPALMEGFGYVLVEAMAAGKPVVAAAASNIPEVVSEGETGLLFPPGDGAALRAAVARVLGDATLARTLGEAGRERVRREFSLPRMLDELEDYFTACAP